VKWETVFLLMMMGGMVLRVRVEVLLETKQHFYLSVRLGHQDNIHVLRVGNQNLR
jgi:hypothetical protein